MDQVNWKQKSLSGSPRRRFEDNTKINPKETGR